jgi:hypothetical protein
MSYFPPQALTGVKACFYAYNQNSQTVASGSQDITVTSYSNCLADSSNTGGIELISPAYMQGESRTGSSSGLISYSTRFTNSVETSGHGCHLPFNTLETTTGGQSTVAICNSGDTFFNVNSKSYNVDIDENEAKVFGFLLDQ